MAGHRGRVRGASLRPRLRPPRQRGPVPRYDLRARARARRAGRHHGRRPAAPPGGHPGPRPGARRGPRRRLRRGGVPAEASWAAPQPGERALSPHGGGALRRATGPSDDGLPRHATARGARDLRTPHGTPGHRAAPPLQHRTHRERRGGPPGPAAGPDRLQPRAAGRHRPRHRRRRVGRAPPARHRDRVRGGRGERWARALVPDTLSHGEDPRPGLRDAGAAHHVLRGADAPLDRAPRRVRGTHPRGGFAPAALPLRRVAGGDEEA